MTDSTHWHGTVRADDGAPVSGVAVSDGRSVAGTDAAGRFTLPVDAASRFIFVSTPRGYHARRWYVPTDEMSPGTSLDFTLTAAPERDADRFTVIHATDIHVSVDHADCETRRGDSLIVKRRSTGRWGRLALTRGEDLADDLRRIARNEADAVAILLTGDLANSGVRPEHEAFARALADVPLVAHCIPGNHDYMDETAREANYEAVLGPRYYSFAIGAVHFVAIDWWEIDRYPDRAERQLTWIGNDLAMLEPDTPVVFLTHDQLPESLLAPYRRSRIVATLSGHRHATRVYNDGRTLHVNTPTLMFGGYDHSPRCYRAVRFRGPEVTVETKAVHEEAVRVRYTFAPGAAGRATVPATEPRVQAAGGWGQFHGNAGRTGLADREIAPPLAHAWTAHLGDALNLGGPVVSDGLILIGLQREDAPGGALVALDVSTGEERWRLPVANSIKRTPAVARGLVVAATVSGEVIAAEAATGEVQWRYQLGDPSCCWIYTAPVIADGVVCLGEAFHFAAVDLATGTARWVRDDFGQRAEFVNMSSPAACGGLVFASFFYQQTNFAALDVATGRTMWAHREGERRAAMSGAAVAHGRLYVSRVHTRLECLDATTGEMSWRAKLGSIFTQATPCITADTVYAVGGLGRVQALDVATGEARWEWQANEALLETAPYMRRTANTIGSPVLAGRYLYVPSNCGRLTVLDAATGRPVWAHDFGVPLPGAPAASGNALFVPAADGSLTALVAA